jgi:hypothetical protein
VDEMSKETGGPAFPQSLTSGPSGHVVSSADTDEFGMTLRDYFAAKAMQAYWNDDSLHPSVTKGNAAEWSYAMADAMMEARK